MDDASPDDVDDVLTARTDSRLVVVRHSENRGVGAATKTGFRKALGTSLHSVEPDAAFGPILLTVISWSDTIRDFSVREIVSDPAPSPTGSKQ